MATYQKLFPPIYSPWGPTQTAREELPGIWHVTTASHGGYILDHARNETIPVPARSHDGSYEEDCCWAIPACVFAKEFIAAHPDFPIETARKTLHDWMPEYYEAITGTPPDPATSYKLKKRALYQQAIGKRIVVSAQRIASKTTGHAASIIRLSTKTFLFLDDKDRPVCADDFQEIDLDEAHYPETPQQPILLDTLLPSQTLPANRASHKEKPVP